MHVFHIYIYNVNSVIGDFSTSVLGVLFITKETVNQHANDVIRAIATHNVYMTQGFEFSARSQPARAALTNELKYHPPLPNDIFAYAFSPEYKIGFDNRVQSVITMNSSSATEDVISAEIQRIQGLLEGRDSTYYAYHNQLNAEAEKILKG